MELIILHSRALVVLFLTGQEPQANDATGARWCEDFDASRTVMRCDTGNHSYGQTECEDADGTWESFMHCADDHGVVDEEDCENAGFSWDELSCEVADKLALKFPSIAFFLYRSCCPEGSLMTMGMECDGEENSMWTRGGNGCFEFDETKELEVCIGASKGDAGMPTDEAACVLAGLTWSTSNCQLIDELMANGCPVFDERSFGLACCSRASVECKDTSDVLIRADSACMVADCAAGRKMLDSGGDCSSDKVLTDLGAAPGWLQFNCPKTCRTCPPRKLFGVFLFTC